MSLLLALLIGMGMGAATGLFFRRNGDYMLFDLLLGIVGSILGLAVVFLANPEEISSLFSPKGIVADIVGAAIFLLLYQIVLRIPKKKKGDIEA